MAIRAPDGANKDSNSRWLELFKTEDGEIIMAVSVSQKVQFMVWAVFVWDEKCRL